MLRCQIKRPKKTDPKEPYRTAVTLNAIAGIGSLHEISICLKHTRLEPVFYADSHGTFLIFLK
jgi:hypothetical protein